METELYTIADYAVDNGGKLTIVGTFDTVFVQTLPAVHPGFMVLKFRVANSEAGSHTIDIIGRDPNGKQVMAVQGHTEVKVNPNYNYSSSSVVIPLAMKLEMTGRYTFELNLDGEFRSGLSLHVVQVPLQLGKAA